MEEQIGIKVTGGGTFVMQGTTKDTVAKAYDGSITGIYVFDLKLTKEFENNGKVVACFKCGRGHGLTKTVQTYAGIQAWPRTNDAIDFAIGQMYGFSDYQKYINPNYKDEAETEFELYYKFELNKYFTISPAVQYFINPQGGNADNKGDIFVCSVRVRMDF